MKVEFFCFLLFEWYLFIVEKLRELLFYLYEKL